jgi:hypothetical protein
MSTTTPTPARSGLSPFKDQTPFDPYLPSSPDEEQLQQVNAAHHASGSHEKQQPQTSSGYRHRDTTHVPGDAGQGGGASRTDTFGLEGFEPQGFENSLLLEDNFGPLPAPYDVNDMSLFRNSSFKRTDTGRTEEPQSASTSRATDFSRRSTGLATHSSQLMSPVLTDAASPEATEPAGSAGRTKLLGGGEMSRVSSASTANAGQYSTVTEQTPALTTSSYEVTPNMANQQQPLFLPTTPSIQVDYHKRGDSPARTDERDANLHKRRRGSRSSSLLAVATANESEEDSENTGDDPAGRRGLDPTARDDVAVSSLKERNQQREAAEKNEQISQWLSVTAANKTDPNELSAPAGVRGYLKPGARRRAASHSNPSDLRAEALDMNQGLQADANARTLGPGLLINEDSGDDDDDVTGS